MDDLKKGDRVTVALSSGISFNGLIVGEGRGGLWWLIIKDGTKSRNGYSKSFCTPEICTESLVGTQDQPCEQGAPSSETHAQLGTK